MIAIGSLLVILAISLTITRVASVLLEHTGLSRDSARFQARSAFTGVGFTTSEAEYVVAHPVRRRIVMWLMLVGNVGIVSSMSAVLLSALDLREQDDIRRLLGLLLTGLTLLWWIGSSQAVDRVACSVIRWALRRWTDLEAEDYVRLLHLQDEYSVARFAIDETHWLAGQTVAESKIKAEGLLLLGLECPAGNFVGVPATDIQVRAGDTLVVYGRSERVKELEGRRSSSSSDQDQADSIALRQQREQEERERVGR